MFLLLCCTSTANSETSGGPEVCADCHAQEYADWRGSVHAKTVFGHKRKKIVACQSCHGALAEGHPGEAKMPIPVSSEMCKTCHASTYAEWKNSRHGQKNIRCFDCHNAHKQGLRAGGGDALCGSCHPGRLKDFAHATHHQEGLFCSSCHMPPSSKGTAGHSLTVGAEVCAQCHEETVHKSGAMQKLREEVSQFQHQVALAGGKTVFELQEEKKELEWKLARAINSAWLAAILGFLAGIGLGWLACWYLLHHKK